MTDENEGILLMKRLITILFGAVYGLCAMAFDGIPDTLCRRLDDAITHTERFVEKRKQRIETIKSELSRTQEPLVRHRIYMRLYDEYAAFQNDSALFCLKKAIVTATQAGRKDLAEDSRTVLVRQLSSTGYYAEGLAELARVDRKALGEMFQKDFFAAANHLYGELGAYTFDTETKDIYYRKSELYRDSLYRLIADDDPLRLANKVFENVNARRFTAALEFNDLQLSRSKPATHDYAKAAYYRQFIYNRMNATDSTLFWLATSALCDVENAVLDQASLWILAGKLNEQGDLERAYRYISYAYDSAEKFGTRIRSWQISPLLSNIDRCFQQNSHDINRRLTWLAVSVSTLALLLIATLLYVMRQRKHLVAARNELHRANKQLSEANERLSSANAALSDSNDKLQDSNRVKEEYIGRFVGICAQNIDKRDAMRRDMARLLKARDYEKLSQMARSIDDKEKEQSEFYVEFDNAFLSLFPDFVDRFNSLLRPEERLQLTNPARLNTPLRIYALVRLGIDNSQTICEYLHHSLNTIYNYRARMRNAALGDREEFEKRVKEIGIMV